MAAGETPSRAFAATWRDSEGKVLGTTWGGTMCWFPRLPWRLRIERDGFEHVIRCGECPGCLEFERLRLAARLEAQYGAPAKATRGSAAHKRRPSSPQRSKAGAPPKSRTRVAKAATAALISSPPQPLYLIRIWAPLVRHAALSHLLHRRKRLDLEPGFYRLGASSFGFLSRNKVLPPFALRRLGLEFRIEPVKLRRGRRAWRALTAGIMVAREVYGEQRKRWYARGLPPAAREKWHVLKLDTYRSYDRAAAPRAWTHGNLVLVPPEVWALRRADRRSIRALLARAPDPESVGRVMQLVSEVSAARSSQSSALASGVQRATADQVRDWYARQKSLAAQRRSADPSRPDLHPSSGGEGYISSGPIQGELLPKVLSAEDLNAIGPSGRPRWMERETTAEHRAREREDLRKERDRKLLAADLERLRQKLLKGK